MNIDDHRVILPPKSKATSDMESMIHHFKQVMEGPRPPAGEVEQLVRSTWEAVTGAYVVEVAALMSPGAAMHYLALHHQKPQQQPPAGWRGMRSRPSKGYFRVPVPELRARAREELTIEAIAYRHGISEAEAAIAYHFAQLPLVGDELDDDAAPLLGAQGAPLSEGGDAVA